MLRKKEWQGVPTYVNTYVLASLADGTDNNLLIEGSWTFLESSACVARDAITIPPSRHNCINGYLLSSSKVGNQKTADSERSTVQRWMMRANEITCFRCPVRNLVIPISQRINYVTIEHLSRLWWILLWNQSKIKNFDLKLRNLKFVVVSHGYQFDAGSLFSRSFLTTRQFFYLNFNHSSYLRIDILHLLHLLWCIFSLLISLKLSSETEDAQI